jgi:uncharacterized membrane protein
MFFMTTLFYARSLYSALPDPPPPPPLHPHPHTHQALDVSEHRQLYMGMLFVGIAIILGVMFANSNEEPRFTKGHAFCFFLSYVLFLMITSTLYA